MITKNSYVETSKEQVSTDLGGEVAILHLTSGIYYSLNEVGARVWQLIQERKTVDDVLATLVAEYDVAPDKCERDLLAVLEALHDENLIQVKHDAPA